MTDYFKIAGEVLQQFRCGVSRLATEPSQPQIPEEVRTAEADPTNLFGKYVRVNLIGRGGGGEVYRAWDTKLGRWVALKFPHLRTPEDRQRLLREANMAARLSHPNIAPLFEFVDEGDRPFIVLQFIDGQTLDRLRLKVSEALEAVRDMANAVAYAHGQGVIHRDLKPQNVMRGEDGRIYVLDFGLAKLAEPGTSLTRTEHLLGTPAYMSPEQANGRRPDVRSDVYSIGTTLYELVTAQPPFVGNTAIEIIRKVQDEDPIAPRRLNPRLPRDVGTIIHKAMERNPKRRYERAGDLSKDIDRFLTGDPIVAHPPSILYRWRRRIFKHRVQASAMAAVVFLTLGFGTYTIYQSIDSARTRRQSGERERTLMELGALWNKVVLAREGIYKPYMKPERVRRDLTEAIKDVSLFTVQHPEYPQGFYVRARGRIYLNDLGGAREDIEHTLSKTPDFAPAWALLARLLFEAYSDKLIGDERTKPSERRLKAKHLLTQAQNALKKARDLGFGTTSIKHWGIVPTREDETILVLLRAYENFSADNVANARQLVLEAHRAVPSEEFCSWLGGATSDPKETARWQSKAIEIAPHNARAYWARGNAQEKLGHLEEAIADCSQAIRIDPEYAEAYFNRAVVYAKIGKLDEAISDYTRTIELNPTRESAHNNRGNVRADKGDLEGAIDDYTRAIEIEPTLVQAYDNLGFVRAEQGDFRAALAYYARAIEVDPRFAPTYCHRGMVHAKQHDPESAIADYDIAIRLNPSYAQAFNNRGVARAELGDQDKAIADYDRAIQIDPRFAQAFNNRGVQKAAKADLEGAISDHTQALKCDPENSKAYYNRGVAHLRQGKYDFAIVDLTRAIEINPGFAEAFNNRGIALRSKSKFATAIENHTRAIEIDPDGPSAYVNRAVARTFTGDLTGAIIDYEKALKRAPSNWPYLNKVKEALRDAKAKLRAETDF